MFIGFDGLISPGDANFIGTRRYWRYTRISNDNPVIGSVTTMTSSAASPPSGAAGKRVARKMALRWKGYIWSIVSTDGQSVSGRDDHTRAGVA